MGRGPDPRDADAFAERQLPGLREAVSDLSWLLGRGYSDVAALKLVGDRFQLTAHQRMAVRRCSASGTDLDARRARQLPLGQVVAIDGFNVLITLERALAGGVLLRGVDGVLRDLAGVHGTYRAVEHTDHAAALVAGAVDGRQVTWFLDRPVSNSGRLAARLRAVADWEVCVVDDVDAQLIAGSAMVVSGDGIILQKCSAWTNLTAELVARDVPAAWIVDLGG